MCDVEPYFFSIDMDLRFKETRSRFWNRIGGLVWTTLLCHGFQHVKSGVCLKPLHRIAVSVHLLRADPSCKLAQTSSPYSMCRPESQFDFQTDSCCSSEHQLPAIQ